MSDRATFEVDFKSRTITMENSFVEERFDEATGVQEASYALKIVAILSPQIRDLMMQPKAELDRLYLEHLRGMAG